MAFRIRHRPREYRRWRFGNSGRGEGGCSAAWLGIQWPGNWTIELNHNNAHTHIVPHRDVSPVSYPARRCLLTEMSARQPPERIENIIREPSTTRWNPGREPRGRAVLWISVAPGPRSWHLGRVAAARNETPFTCRAFTHVAPVPPPNKIPTKLSTFEHAPTTEYSGNHTSSRYKAVSVRQMWAGRNFRPRLSSFWPGQH